jgi:hypothetical protein
MFKKFSSLSGSCGSGKTGGKEARVGAPKPRPAYFGDVMKKLRSVERLKGMSEEEAEVMVKELTEEEILWSVYFSGVVLDPARQLIEEQLGEGESDVGSGRTAGGKVPVKYRFRKVQDGSQYGIQTFSSMLLKHYGPIHASMVVGGTVVLEWLTSGLVIPTGKALPPATSSVRYSSVASNITTISTPDTTEEVFELTLVKKEFVDKLMNVIVKYNRNYYYHPIHRNCLKFVADCLFALGRTVPPIVQVVGKLGDYMTDIKQGKKRRLDFESHADLDTYIDDALLASPKTSPLEREYLLMQYFLFHVESMTECEDPDKWGCDVVGCRMPRLEQSVDLKNTIAYQKFGSEH